MYISSWQFNLSHLHLTSILCTILHTHERQPRELASSICLCHCFYCNSWLDNSTTTTTTETNCSSNNKHIQYIQLQSNKANKQTKQKYQHFIPLRTVNHAWSIAAACLRYSSATMSCVCMCVCVREREKSILQFRKPSYILPAWYAC